MNIIQILHQLFLGPIELLFDCVFAFVLRHTGSPGWSIVMLSLIMNLLLLPLYMRADILQREYQALVNQMKPRIDQIKAVFTGNERFMLLQTYYRQQHYKPWHVLKGSVSLLLQVPFFMVAYNFLSNLQVLQGVSFGPILDLSIPDGLIRIGNVSINVLPILMTLINLVSAIIYSKDASKESKIQVYSLAGIFLILLYQSPSGLVLYWILNNTFSLVKNIIQRYFGSHKAKTQPVVTLQRQSMSLQQKGIFISCCIFLALMTGLLIPSEVIKSSMLEFTNIWDFQNPLRYLLSSLLLAVGLFVVWGNIFFAVCSNRGRRILLFVFGTLGAVGLFNCAVSGNLYGDMSSLLQYFREPSSSLYLRLINLELTGVIIVCMAFLIYKKPGLVLMSYISICIGLGAFSVSNVLAIQSNFVESKQYADSLKEQSPAIHLSKDGKNVIVIMVDRAIGGLVPYILNEKPELKEQFAGFTYYANTLSFGGHTNVGSPPLYGGYEYTPDNMAVRSDELLVDKHNEALKVMPVLFSENGYDVTVIDPSLANYKWIPDLSIYDEYPEIHKYNITGYFADQSVDVDEYSDVLRNRNLFCYSIFRIAPMFLHTILYDGGRYNATDIVDDTQVNPNDLVGVNPALLKNYWAMENLDSITEIQSDTEGCFLMLTTEIAHDALTLFQEPEYIPKQHVDNSVYEAEHGIRVSLNGDQLDIGNAPVWQRAFYQVNMAGFLKLGSWFQYLRDNGVWDNTRIIIVSDHAADDDLFGFDLIEKYPELASVVPVDNEMWTSVEMYQPVLMVKDFDADESIVIDDTFMTNADVPTLATQDIIENPVNPFTGKKITSDPKYTEVLHVYESDWHVEANNGTMFANPHIMTVKNGDINDPDNWIIESLESGE